MTVKKINTYPPRWICTCDLPDCIKNIGKGRSWISAGEEIPDCCRWCKRLTWNRPDRRTKAERTKAVRDASAVPAQPKPKGKPNPKLKPKKARPSDD